MEATRRDFFRLLSGAASLNIANSFLVQGSSFGPAGRRIPSPEPQSFSVSGIREQFPALNQQVNGSPFIYLDSAATTHRPRAVVEATSNFYQRDNANPSATLHTLARRSAAFYADARKTVARFINARSPEEIVWTRGTTEAINLVASSWGSARLRPDDEILLTQAEHYSNLLPWRLIAERTGARLRFLEVDDEGRLQLGKLSSLLTPRTRIVSFTHISNVLGRINPAEEICEQAHRAGAVVLMDAAQSVPHLPVDVQALGCDFLAFSGHKMLGPMGIGVLWARRDLLDALPPYQSGSNMAHEVDSLDVPVHFGEGAHKFEAGTPNAAGAIGLAAAIDYLESTGRAELWKREQELTAYALERLQRVPDLRILGATTAAGRISVFSFVLENVPVPEIVRALDDRGIAVRGGDLAALPLLKRLGVSAAARASAYIYTQESEINSLVAALKSLAPGRAGLSVSNAGHLPARLRSQTTPRFNSSSG